MKSDWVYFQVTKQTAVDLAVSTGQEDGTRCAVIQKGEYLRISILIITVQFSSVSNSTMSVTVMLIYLSCAFNKLLGLLVKENAIRL